jgi:hypothetical protein
VYKKAGGTLSRFTVHTTLHKSKVNILAENKMNSMDVRLRLETAEVRAICQAG